MTSLLRRSPLCISSRPILARRTSAQTAAVRPARLSTSTSARPTLPPSTATPTSRPQQRSLFLLSSALLSGGLLAGLGLSLVLPRPQIVNLVFPLPTPHPPPATSREASEHAEQIEQGLWQLELVKRLQSETIDPATATTGTTPTPRWKISRPYAATPAGPHSLSGYSLKGPNKFAIPPLVFTSPDKREAVFVLHVGKGLCGHEGVVHGGLLATVLDEALGRTALLNLPTNIGVTATLNLKYRKPTFAAQYIVIKTNLVEQKGRKAWVQGRIENTEGECMVEAEALFVEPKMARFLSNSSVREALK
ncbi:PaaI family thioesterase [Sporobolomyces koalae]|uniref:PaaI family thioesterase n=1 Tax=Sporobolomyces koalae TaxID=500713 RepID=UPI003182289C